MVVRVPGRVELHETAAPEAAEPAPAPSDQSL